MRVYCLIFFLTISSLLLTAHEKLVTTYTTTEGVPNQIIYDCVQDTLGYMWFATEGGTIKYDGVNWTNYDTLEVFSDVEAIGQLQLDMNGNIWAFPYHFRSKAYIYNYKEWIVYDRFDIGNSINYSESIDSYITNTDTIIVSAKGDIENVTSNIMLYNLKILLLLNNKFHIITYFQEKRIRVFNLLVNYEILLVGTDEGLFKFALSDIEKGIYDQPLNLNNKPVLAIDYVKYKNDQNELIYLTPDELVRHSKNSSEIITSDFSVTYTESTLNHLFLTCLNKTAYFFGSKYESFYYQPHFDNIMELSKVNGFTTDGATDAYFDREKNAWISTQRGINKVKQTPFANYSKRNGLLESEIASIESFEGGKIVLGHNNGFTLLDSNSFQKIELDKSSPESRFSRIINMQYDSQSDRIWFISQYLGLGYLNIDGELKWIYKDKSRPRRSYLSLFVNNSKLFFSDGDGVYGIENGIDIPLLIEPAFNVRKIAKFSEKELILATRRGVVIFNLENNEYSVYSSSDFQFNNIYSLFKIKENEWLVGSSAGLLIFDGKSLKNFQKLEITTSVFFIGKENEFLWFGLMGGAIRWNTKTNESRLFQSPEGLIGSETNRDAFLFKDDKVFIGSDGGLSIFSPKLYNTIDYNIKPKLHLLEVLNAVDELIDYKSETNISYENNTLKLRYRGLSFLDEKSIRYRITINNFDEETTEIVETDETEYVLRNLEPAEYDLEVVAINERGVESKKIKTARFTILKPFYEESWFFTVMILLSVTVLLIMYDYINKNRRSQALEKEVKARTLQLSESEKDIRELTQKLFSAQELERQKIARDLHDNVAQDLALVRMEVEKHSKESKVLDNSQLNWMADKLNDLGRYIKDLAFYIHPNSLKQTGLVNAIQARCTEFTELTGIQIDFFSRLEDKIDLTMEQQTNLYRIVQEALANIRKHSNAANGIIIISRKDDYIQLRIEDDGIGFDENKIINKDKAMGLKSMEERTVLLGGTFQIKSGEGDGTKIFVNVPRVQSA